MSYQDTEGHLLEWMMVVSLVSLVHLKSTRQIY